MGRSDQYGSFKEASGGGVGYGLASGAAFGRVIPLSSAIAVAFGGALSLVAWVMFALSMILWWVFGPHSDLTSWYRFNGEQVVVTGTVFRSYDTGYSIGGDEDSPGAPIYEIHYQFRTSQGYEYPGTCYTTGVSYAEKQAVRVDGVDFIIRDGRIHYDNFTMVFAGVFDLKFYGSVGFDDTLDMTVSIPVSAALLEKFGARGPVVEYARLLKGARIAVPLVGSRQNPRLDFSKVDIGPLIKQAIEALLSEQLGNTLEKLLKSKLLDKDQPDGLPDPNDDANDEDGGSLLDSLLDLLE